MPINGFASAPARKVPVPRAANAHASYSTDPPGPGSREGIAHGFRLRLGHEGDELDRGALERLERADAFEAELRCEGKRDAPARHVEVGVQRDVRDALGGASVREARRAPALPRGA